MFNDNGSDDLLTLATWMYYEDEMTHQQIADELSLSRVAVTRLLQRARREGIVKFNITRPRPLAHQLARRLVSEFGLREAWIVKSGETDEETLQRIGQRAADSLLQLIFPGCRIGIGWSSTVRHMTPYLRPPDQPMPLTINELAGSMLGHNNPYSISMDLARALGGSLETLPVPALVQSSAVRDVLLGESAVRAALEHAACCDIAFVGIGDCGPRGTMLQTGAMTAEQMATIRRQGAVGEVLLRYFTIDGAHVPTVLDNRIITLEWAPLLSIPYTVGVACGSDKVQTIIGALRGGVINGLISDTTTVQAVLDTAGG